jgi:hypothetical protein
MRWNFRYSFFAISLLLASCGSCDEAIPSLDDRGLPVSLDASDEDANGGTDGEISDAGELLDGAPVADAGQPDPNDSGLGEDGGPGPSDSGLEDTGLGEDGGPSPSDSGLEDSGPSDSGLGDDGGPAPDSGARDAGTSPDAGPNPNNPSSDFDCDGLSDAEEAIFGTNPALADSDFDGLSDGLEVGRTSAVTGSNCAGFAGDQDPATTTNPLAVDSDGDAIRDGVEDRDHNGRVDLDELDPNASDSDGDLLDDGIEDRNNNGLRDLWETDGTRADTDLDGIDDGVEDLDRDGMLDGGESNPLFVDTDFDGLDDGFEDINRNGIFDLTETSATLFDTDLDGLRDGCEDRNQNGVHDTDESDPRANDTDFDALDDGDEDVNANCTVDSGETDPSNSDTDCDALSDFTEIGTTYSGGLRTNALIPDTDADLLTDGIEAGSNTIVPFSTCAAVALDLQPGTRTNPTIIDTDGDGRSDGCEDRNRNGRRDGNEMDPLAPDTDGDGLTDAQEDPNGSCTRNANETNAAAADTDGDGIGDAIEISLGTNPTLADTDGDGLNDGVEDANQNGVVEPNETNPNLSDTDGDGIPDGTEDADHDGTVDAGETDPRDADTDDDGLTDQQEIAAGTNPNDNDSDNDNLLDGEELIRGTNPNDSDSDNDGVLDGDEVIAGTNPNNANDPNPTVGSGINTICSTAGLKVVQFQNHAGANTQVSLESSYTFAQITVAGGDSAAVLADNALGIAGFVLNIAAPVAGTNPTNQAQALLARLTGGLATLGATAVNVQNNGRAITTHDNFGAVVDIRANLTFAANERSTTVRNRVMAVLSNLALNQFTGLPGPAGGTSTSYVLRFQSLVRTGPTRIVAVGSLVPQASFDDPATVHRAQVEDLSNGTALARAYSTNATGCDPFVAAGTPRADFIWMADVSASTDNDRGTIATAADTIFTALANNGVDFRMGVVPHFENRIMRGGPANAGDLRSGFTRNRQTFINDLNNTANTDGCEYGLTAADDALNKALPRTPTGQPENVLRLREDAQLVVFYISDEHAQEVENFQCGRLNLGTGLGDIHSGVHEGAAVPSAAQQVAIDNIAAPFVTNIRNNNGIAFAQIHPIQAPYCFVDFPADEEEGYGYYEAATGTGGTFYRVCDNNPGAVLQDIIDAISGAASEYVLADTPISSTIKVGLTRQNSTTTTVVPRSSVQGFDYDAAANTIFFRGTTFRPNLGDSVTISYRIFEEPNPPVNCAPPLVLNTVTNTCECPGDCGILGGCTSGQLCDRDPAVCSCECTPNCGGLCRGAETCDVNSCSCVCAADCGGTCTGNQVCNQGSCTCACPANCGGACVNNQVCDATTCACECPADCGGCPSGQTCDVASCACVGAPL